MALNFRNEVLVRVYIVTAIVLAVAMVIYFKAFLLVTREGERWRKEADKLSIRNREVPGERGNILADDGSLLATSLPIFEIRMDFAAQGLGKEEFVKNMDSLAFYLANYLTPERSNYDEWRNYLWQHFVNKSRYELIAKEISAEQLKVLKLFPIFRGGRAKGFIAIRINRREHPFKMLALRTLGYVKDDLKVGLEGKFDKDLSGGKEIVPMVKVGNDVWVPLQDLTDIEPKNGDDLVTTLDVNIQDITQTALIRSCDAFQAEHGCAVVMEVKTGKIKAIANISRTKEGSWWEDLNYAIGGRVEPGSTWKLASMLALLEDDAVRLSDTVDIEGGRHQYSDVVLEDHERTNKNLVTVKEAFSASSNVGISKLVYRQYNDKRQQYIKHLEQFNLTVPTGVEIEGELAPIIKNADDATWSGITLPWMSIGYELEVTPLQLLTFYNAVANNGVMMKPYLVSEIRRYNETERAFKPTIINKRIASPKALTQARELLESVVDLPGGTAYKLRSNSYRFAGKTGTAQLNYSKDKAGKHTGGYQGSFVGYFPAENPVYSCIVLISKPKFGHYGGIVAAPVFREIADKLTSSNIALSEPVNQKGKPVPSPASLPDDVGFKGDLLKMLQSVGLNHEIGGTKEDDWSYLKAKSDTLNVLTRQVGNRKQVPSVVGMGLKDALYLLENRGLRVSFSGYGKVIAQSLSPGGIAVPGNIIKLQLE